MNLKSNRPTAALWISLLHLQNRRIPLARLQCQLSFKRSWMRPWTLRLFLPGNSQETWPTETRARQPVRYLFTFTPRCHCDDFSSNFLYTVCGKPVYRWPKIVSGENARPGQWPWQVFIIVDLVFSLLITFPVVFFTIRYRCKKRRGVVTSTDAALHCWQGNGPWRPRTVWTSKMD